MKVIEKELLKHTLMNPPVYLRISGSGLKDLIALIDALPEYDVKIKDTKNLKK